jgi:hypothetical protein
MDRWWTRFKCTASPGEPNVQGRYDPLTDATLFTDETKGAFNNCQQHAGDITDVLSKGDLYEAVEPPLRSKNHLTIWIRNIVVLNQFLQKLIMRLLILLMVVCEDH